VPKITDASPHDGIFQNDTHITFSILQFSFSSHNAIAQHDLPSLSFEKHVNMLESAHFPIRGAVSNSILRASSCIGNNVPSRCLLGMKLQCHMDLSMQPTLKPKSLYSVNPVPPATATAGISGNGCNEYEWRSKSKAIQGPHRSKEIAEITAREENQTPATERGC
jgi:hypothetical protein